MEGHNIGIEEAMDRYIMGYREADGCRHVYVKHGYELVRFSEFDSGGECYPQKVALRVPIKVPIERQPQKGCRLGGVLPRPPFPRG